MDFSPQQDEAAKKVKTWLQEKDKQVFRLFGYAGTGKTTITRHLVEDVKGKVLYGAYTGKAALVMRRNGMPASTLHSLVYKFEQPSKREFDSLRKEMESAGGREKKEIERALNDIQKPQFILNPESELEGAALLVVDECSMVYDELAEDLFSFNVPILVLGDPGQLPPVKGAGVLTEATPDAMLTEIHRQAEGNPIIEMATKTRKGQPLLFGEYGDSLVKSKQDLTRRDVMDADQMIAGYNKNRRNMNMRYREITEKKGDYPLAGEKLICLRNDKENGIFNGLMGRVTEDAAEDGMFLSIKFQAEDKDPEKHPPQKLICHKAHFDEYHKEGTLREMTYWDMKLAQEFDFAYVITCHKAQGSQWDNVLVYDDGFGRGRGDTRMRWLYTAITRASKRLTIVR